MVASLLAVSNAGVIEAPLGLGHYAAAPALHYAAPAAVGATHQSTIQTAHGTVSHHSKAVDTPYSSVRKYDTRVTNESPAYAVHAPVLAHAPVVAHAPVLHYSPASAVSHISYHGKFANYAW